MVAQNIIFIIKTLVSEGYITINADYNEIKSILDEFDLNSINTENFSNENFSNENEY